VAFRKAGFQPAAVNVRLAEGQQTQSASVTLVPGGGLSVRSNIPGELTVRGTCGWRIPVRRENKGIFRDL
jgi:hypothetical protein